MKKERLDVESFNEMQSVIKELIDKKTKCVSDKELIEFIIAKMNTFSLERKYPYRSVLVSFLSYELAVLIHPKMQIPETELKLVS